METLTGRDLKSGGLLESLLRQMDSKHHWFWDHLNSPLATRAQLLVHFQQEWEVYVRDFPLFLRRVHDRCPHPDVRDAIAGNIAEEERGAVSGAGPHSELFLYMMEGLGFSRSQFLGVRLLPEAAAYRRWLDDATTAYWLVGAAVTMVFVEGSVEDRAAVNDPGNAKPARAIALDHLTAGRDDRCKVHAGSGRPCCPSIALRARGLPATPRPVW